MEHKQTKERTYSIEIGKVTVEVPLDAASCLICANEIKTVAIGECGHRVICDVCLLRLRWVMKGTACPVCKSNLGTLFITSNLSAKYEDLMAKRQDYIQDQTDPNVYFEYKETCDYMMKLKSYCCLWLGCGKYLYDQKGLEAHLKTAHNRALCDICFKNRPVFVGEQIIYPSHKLQDHMKYGEHREDIEIKPHPLCTFCNKYFYTEEPLLNHLSKVHMNCHLCAEKCKHIYYKDYKDLELHFQKSHYLCANEVCRDKCFVVFGTLEELHIHNHKEHGAFGPAKGLSMDALKAGFFTSSDIVPSKSLVNDGVGTDFSHYFSNEYYQKLKEEYEAKNQTGDYRQHEEHKKRGGRREHVQRGAKHGQPYESQEVQYVKRSDIGKEEAAHKEKYTEQTPIPSGSSSKEQSVERLRNEIYNLIKKKLAIIGISKVECSFEKEQLFQMTKLIENMSIENLAQCDYMMNFGISLSLKKHLSYLIQNNNGRMSDEEELAALSLRELLIIYKYLDTAVQKIHKKYIKMELAEINPDLLDDFKEGPKKSKQPKLGVDYRDALKPTINYDDAKAFPELQSKKPAKKGAGANVWQKLDKPAPIKTQTKDEKSKKGLDDEFPELPQQAAYFPPSQKEVKKVEELKKIPDSEAFPTFKEADKEDEKDKAEPKGKKERKKKKQGKQQPGIEFGFY